MTDEIEAPTENLHEALKEEAEGPEHEHGEGRAPWIPRAALSAAVMSVIAAIAALQAGAHANEAMLDQMQASDEWSYYQAKGVKSHLLETRIQLLAAMGKPASPDDTAKLDAYGRDQKEIDEKAREFAKGAQEHMHHHEWFARSVTMSQIAIALSAIAVLARRKLLWFLGVAMGFGGAALLVRAII